MSDITAAMIQEPGELLDEARFQLASPEERAQLLNENIFAGSAAKQIVPIELWNGDTGNAVFQRYEPACLKLWSLDEGVVRLPFQALSAELQQCFPQDVGVQWQRGVAAITEQTQQLLEDVAENANQNTEAMQFLAERVKALEEDMQSTQSKRDAQEARIAELEAENTRLREENERLKMVLDL